MGIAKVRKKNPRVNMPPLTQKERTCEIVALLFVLLTIFIAWRAYLTLPSTIAMHFDIKGTPDSFVRSYNIFFMPILAVFMTAIMKFSIRFPWFGNYCGVTITEQNAVKLYGIARKALIYIDVLTTGVIWYFTSQIINVSFDNTQKMSVIPLVLYIVAVDVIVVFMIIKMIKESNRSGDSGISPKPIE